MVAVAPVARVEATVVEATAEAMAEVRVSEADLQYCAVKLTLQVTKALLREAINRASKAEATAVARVATAVEATADRADTKQ